MKKELYFGFTVDDIGYDGYSTEAHLRNILNFCDELGIRATLFVVPLVNGKRIDQRKDYVAILRDALQRGHEVGQHGLTHDRFEVGIPPAMILDLPHEAANKRHLEEDRAEIEQSLSVDKIRSTLREGREILELAIGQKLTGFRAPALQVCDNLFRALELEGYRYDSSLYLQERGWDLLNGTDSAPRAITHARFDEAQPGGTLLELPLTTEYTWELTRAKYDEAFALLEHDTHACAEAEIPFVNLAHVSPIQEGEGNQGFRFYREWMEAAQRTGLEVHALTLSAIAEAWRSSGNVPTPQRNAL